MSIKAITNISILLTIVLLSSCSQQSEQSNTKDQQAVKPKSKLNEQYLEWKAKQDPQLLKEYQQFFSSFLKNPPPLMELVTNRNFVPEHCEIKRFSIPPKKYWNNIKPSMLLLEKLHQNEYFKTYTVTATYRNPELNTCVEGAKKSKHMQNYAVDFHILNPKETNAEESKKLEQRLCEFWHKEGKPYKMGLGVYGNNRFHIDTQGYRTWGKNYSSSTSPCLKH